MPRNSCELSAVQNREMAKKRPSTKFVTAHSDAQRWPRRTSAPSVFTSFVRSLHGAHTPDADLFHDAWHLLRAVLVKEMKRRGLWESPPSYLGACGWERWDSEVPDPRFPGFGGAQVSALEELVADCYAYAFVDRQQCLKRHLLEKPDIDGLVRLNVRNFLYERQREHDPLGFRLFELLQAAVEGAISAGALFLLAGDRRVRNDTLLGFDPAGEAPAVPPDLEPVVRRWNDELMPDLVTACGRQQPAVVQRLRERLLELPGAGVEAFRFKDLLDPLKRDVRERWAVLLVKEEKGSVAPSTDAAQALASPPSGGGIESRLGFEHLTRSVSAAIDRMEPSRTRTQLAALWQYLRRQHGEEGAETGTDLPDPGAGASYRQLSQRLKIPRDRLPRLFARLRELVPR